MKRRKEGRKETVRPSSSFSLKLLTQNELFQYGHAVAAEGAAAARAARAAAKELEAASGSIEQRKRS